MGKSRISELSAKAGLFGVHMSPRRPRHARSDERHIDFRLERRKKKKKKKKQKKKKKKTKKPHNGFFAHLPDNHALIVSSSCLFPWQNTRIHTAAFQAGQRLVCAFSRLLSYFLALSGQPRRSTQWQKSKAKAKTKTRESRRWQGH